MSSIELSVRNNDDSKLFVMAIMTPPSLDPSLSFLCTLNGSAKKSSASNIPIRTTSLSQAQLQRCTYKFNVSGHLVSES